MEQDRTINDDSAGQVEGESSLRPELQAALDANEGVLDRARPDAVRKQHDRGKLTARERIDLLLDEEDRLEYGALVTPDETKLAPGVQAVDLVKGADCPADGVITCTGLIDGRPVTVGSVDFTVLGGSSTTPGGAKMRAMAELSLRRGIPFLNLLDGAGHRIHAMDSRMFAFGGSIGPFDQMPLMSGWTPLVAAIMGPAFAGPAMIAGLADFVPMVKGTSSLGMAGPKLVKAGTGEDLSAEELGGSAVHLRTGVADVEAEDDRECINLIREYLSYFPTNAAAPLPTRSTEDPPDRASPELRDVVPPERRRAYDVKAVLHHVLDDGQFLEVKPRFAENIVTALGRLEGTPVGVVANQPKVLAGTLDGAACTKAAHFIYLCNAFGLPLVVLIDTPGFLVGCGAESQALVRVSSKLLMAFGHATVPLVTLVLRKAYGGGYVAMAGGRSYGAEGVFIWPTAEICAMGIEGSVDIAFHREYEAAPDPAARRAELIESFYEQATPARAASGFGVDAVIDPAETRRHLAAALRVSRGRRPGRLPPKHHHIEPF